MQTGIAANIGLFVPVYGGSNEHLRRVNNAGLRKYNSRLL